MLLRVYEKRLRNLACLWILEPYHGQHLRSREQRCSWSSLPLYSPCREFVLVLMLFARRSFFGRRENVIWLAISVASIFGIVVSNYLLKAPPISFCLGAIRGLAADAPTDGLPSTIFVLRARAHTYSLQASTMLVILIVSVTSNLVVFTFADQLTNLRYIQRNSFMAILQKQSDDVARGQEFLRITLGEIIKKSDVKDDDKFDQTLRPLRDLTDQMGAQQNQLISNIKVVQASLLEDNVGATSQRDRDPYAPYWARGGSLFILVFAARIFWNLYRYNTSIALHYNAIADGLAIFAAVHTEKDDVSQFLDDIRQIVRPPEAGIPKGPSPWERIVSVGRGFSKRGKARRRQQAKIKAKATEEVNKV